MFVNKILGFVYIQKLTKKYWTVFISNFMCKYFQSFPAHFAMQSKPFTDVSLCIIHKRDSLSFLKKLVLDGLHDAALHSTTYRSKNLTLKCQSLLFFQIKNQRGFLFYILHVCLKNNIHKIREKREDHSLFTKYVDEYSHNSQGQR